MVLVTAGPRHALGMAVQELVLELGDLARIDTRFEHAVELATALQDELVRLSDGAPTVLRPKSKRVGPRRRVSRGNSSKSAALASLRMEHQALSAVVRRAERAVGQLSFGRIAMLRMADTTRQVFADAGFDDVHQVIDLPSEQAMLVPNLDAAALSQLRAALMVALEAWEVPCKPMLPAARDGEDLYEGVAQGLGQLSWNERETLVMCTGANDRIHSVEEAADVLNLPVQFIPVLEQQAITTLLSQPAVLDACWRLEALCAQYGIGWDDERLQKLVATLYPSTRANLTRLVAGLLREKGRVVAELTGRTFEPPVGVLHFEEMVAATISRYGDMESEQLAAALRTAMPESERASYPEMRISERVRILGPAVQREDGRFHLADTAMPGIEDRHMRALNSLIGVLQRLGSARISALTTEANRRLPRQSQIDAQHVRTWLTRHPELFVQTDADRFKLASLDVDILCGLTESWSRAGNEPTGTVMLGGRINQQRYERNAASIVEYLRREGPQPIWKIRSHLYGRMGPPSVDAVVSAFPFRFDRQDNGIVSLRDSEEVPAGFMDPEPPTRNRSRQRWVWAK